MERVESLKKVKNQKSFRGCLSKLKLDLSKPTSKIVDKIITYLAKDLKDIDFNEVSPAEILKFNNFHVDVIEQGKILDSKSKDNVKRVYKIPLDDKDPIYEVTVFDSNNEGSPIKIYTMPTKSISVASTRRAYYGIPCLSDHHKILDINFIYGVLKILDIVYEEVKEKKDFYLSSEFKEVSVFDNSYTEEEFEEILSVPNKTKFSFQPLVGYKFTQYYGVLRLLVDVVLVMQTFDSNIVLTEKYNKETNSECARAFETKQNIPEKVLKLMSTTKFLDNFSYVEIDEDTELSKFRVIEKEWGMVKAALGLDKYFEVVKPELRFKRLGKHRAKGLYYPSLRCICVDINSMSSALHEIGHFIDYSFMDNQLSLSLEFFPIITDYKLAFFKEYEEIKETEIGKYLRRKMDYYFTPTEIFARCLEIYLVNKEVKSSFLKVKEKLTIDRGYPRVEECFLSLIDNYFSKMFTINLELLEEKSINLLQEVKRENIFYIPPVQTSRKDGQYSFAI